MRVSRADVSSAATEFDLILRMHLGLRFSPETRCCRASLLLPASLWELTNVLERTDVAGVCETQDGGPGDGF